MCKFGKIIIDNRDNVSPFYDGLSMGCGQIAFKCSTCGYDIAKETIFFKRDNENLDSMAKEKIKNFLGVIKFPYYGQYSSVGLLKCVRCNSKFALYISSGEVQMARYQASLIAVVECK